jgi:hypothetical protein
MSAQILVCLLVAIVGLLAYVLAANAKVAEIGRLAFACGLLVTLFDVATHVWKL